MNLFGSEFDTGPGASGGSPVDDDVQRILKQVFHFPSLRAGQREMIDAQRAGKNVSAVISTGGGKSLGFYVPALLEHESSGAVTVVISPLIALINDQVKNLRARNIPAVALHGLMSDSERGESVKLLHEGQAPLLYLGPEMLSQDKTIELLKGLNIARLVVDEAHCAGEWDFRPAYGRIKKVRELLGNPPLTAVTATEPPHTRSDIHRRLGIEGCEEIVLSVDRPDLDYSIKHFANDGEKLDALQAQCKTMKGSTIIFCSKVLTVKRVVEALKEAGVNAVPYHARMDRDDRESSQAAFMNDDVQFIVATKAFGMGIDKEDVRNVVHYELPGSIEQYYQETGRASRDGLGGNCFLYYTPLDYATQYYFLRQSNPSLELVIETFERLRRVSAEASDHSNPTIKFNERLFLNDIELYHGPSHARQIAACLAILEENGVIFRLGNRLTFLFYGEENWREEFPVTQEYLSRKFRNDHERQKCMLYVATQVGSDPRQAIMDYMERSAVRETVSGVNPIRMIDVNQTDLEKVCHAVALGDREKKELLGFLIGGEDEVEDPLYGSLSHLRREEVAFLVHYAEHQKLLRTVSLGERNFLNATAAGVQALFQRGIEVPEDISSYQEMKPFLFRDESKTRIKEAIEPWFSLQVEGGASTRWPEVLGFFMESSVLILDSRVSVAQLIRDYFHLPNRTPLTTAHAAELVKLVFQGDRALPPYIQHSSLGEIERQERIRAVRERNS